MLSLLRNKAIILLAAYLLGGMLLGGLQRHIVSGGRSFIVQDLVCTVMAPVGRLFQVMWVAGTQTVRVFRPRYAILRENAALRREVTRLSRENATLRQATMENVNLRAALKLRDNSSLKMTLADVISRKPSNWFDTAIIDRGRGSNIDTGSAVITPRLQLVGQVLSAGRFTSQIVALTDSNSNVGAMVERSRSSGILTGQGSDYLVLSYLPKEADVKESDIVVSSGMGGVIPKGLPIGRVVKVQRNAALGTSSALVRPSVELDRIEQVFIVKPGQGSTP